MTSKEAYNYLLGLLESGGDMRWSLVKESMDKFKELIDQQSDPTLSECIKEWEDRGWTYHKSEYYNWFFVKKEYKEICFDYDKINYECESFFEIDLELNILITKTLKAMKEMK